MGISIYSPPPMPSNEAERNAAVLRSGILDARGSTRIAEIARFAADQLGTGMAAATAILGDRQIILGGYRLDVTETARSTSLCGYTILDPTRLFCVPDTLADDRFAGNPIATEFPPIRFYLGAPLVAQDGFALGALCVFDSEPDRPMDARAYETLRGLAALTMDLVAEREDDASLAQPPGTTFVAPPA